MARKSNKTAHVLNLLSGHDTKKEPEKELETDVKKDADPISEQDSQPKDAQQPHPDPEPTEKIPQGKISVPDSPSVSIIDQTEKDPVAEQIQANLFQEFQKEHDMLLSKEKPLVGSVRAERRLWKHGDLPRPIP